MIPIGWKKESLGNWIEEFREKSTVNDQHPVLTSSRNGLIPQSEYYGEAGRITSRDNVGFHVVPPMHITYRSRSDDGLFFFNRNETGITGIVSYYYPVFRFRGDDTFFLALLEHIRNRIGDYAVGSSQRVLSLNALRSVEAIIPPVDEQRRIAEILSTWDRSIEATEKLIANSQAQKKALMQQLLTGKKRLPGFSEEWTTLPLGELCDIAKGEQKGRAVLSATGPVPVINGGITPSGFTDIPNTDAGTITISEGGNSCGYVDLITKPFWCGGHCYALKNVQINRDYLFAFLKHYERCIMSLRVGSGLPNIQKSSLSQFAIAFPPTSEQVKIGKIAQVADTEIERLGLNLGTLKSQKSALMQQLLTGKRRVKLPSAQEEEVA